MRNLKKTKYGPQLTLVAILIGAILPHTVLAGDLFSMDMRVEVEAPGVYPVPITVNIYEGSNVDPDKLEGTSTASFDGGSLSGVGCDAVACITGASLDGANLVVNYSANGWDNGQFKTETTFEVIVGGSATTLTLHTSCSRILYVDRPYPGEPGGTFFIESGTGDCFTGPDDCPPGDKLYWLVGEFRVPIPPYGPVVFNVYKNDDDLRATATALFNGVELVDIQNGFAALLDGGYVDGGELVISFTSYGYKDNGEFESNSRFEMITNGGMYFLDQHTSCSDPIYLNLEMPASPAGSVIYTDGCGGCIETGEPPVDCPYDDKLYWLAGEFRVPCTDPADITFTVYEKDNWDQPEGTATAYFDGTALTGITNDLVALLMYAQVDAGELVVGYEAFGFDDDKFKTETSLEIIVGGCGVFRLEKYHTSCSRPIEVDVPLPMDPSGTNIFLNYCGCEDNVVPIEDRNWGSVKSLFR
jgi:hypothetical protein